MDKQETVTIIRSILSSTKEPMSINDLNRNFIDVIGSNIPLFDHISLEHFLSSIPETVKLSGIAPNLQVNLISNNKSEHIVSLVRRQRSSTEKTFGKNWWKSENIKAEIKVGRKNDSVNEYGNLKLHQYLLKCEDGCSLEDIKTLIPELKNLDEPLKQFRVISFLKNYPFCMYINGKFYATEIFQKKLLKGCLI